MTWEPGQKTYLEDHHIDILQLYSHPSWVAFRPLNTTAVACRMRSLLASPAMMMLGGLAWGQGESTMVLVVAKVKPCQ